MTAGFERIYNDAALYEQLYPEHHGDLEFYLRQARGRVLELGCGAGRLTVPLAEAGHATVGVDLSESMLQRARERAPHLDWRRGDMRELRLEQRFDTVIVAFNALQHCLLASQLRQVFQVVQLHLAPGGRFLFDVYLPDLVLLLQAPGTERRVFPHLEFPRVTETNHYDAAAQVMHTTWRFDGEPVHLPQRCYFPQELLELVETVGWRVLGRFGDFSEGPLQGQCSKQIYICERAGPSF